MYPDFPNNKQIQKNLAAEYQRVKSNLKNVLHSVNFCGLCLEKDRDMVHVDFYSNTDDEYSIERIVQELFGETIINNMASNFICETCRADISQAFMLISKVKHSAYILSSYFDQMSSQLESVEDMVDSTENCDFENTIIVLQDTVKDTVDKSNYVIPKVEYSTSSEDDYEDEDDVKEKRKCKFHLSKGKKFTCEYCSKNFSTKAFVAHHIKTSHSSNYDRSSRENCLVCSEIPCAHEKYLLSIRTQRNRGATELKCLDCDYTNCKKVNLLAHINTEHLNLYPYLCENCGKNFASKKKQYYHMKKFHQDKYSCAYCDEQFKEQTALETHIENCKDQQRFYKCKDCPASFDSEDGLVMHQHKHTKKLQCELCSKKVKNSYFLKRHMFYAHQMNIELDQKLQKPKDDRPRPCSICPMVLYSLTDLRVHLSTHQPDEKHKCDTCNKQFDTRKQYNIHVSSWTHLRKVDPNVQFNFKCNDCDYTCKSKLVMENHKNTVHLHVKPYACERCGKRFTTSTNLKYHMDRHEGLRRFQCSVCSNLFTTASGLKKHVLRHHSERRPFSCDSCDKTFVNKSECNLHKLRNHSVKAITCLLCEAKFASLANLRGHTKKVHFKTKDGFEEFMNSDNVSKEFYEMFRDHRLTF